jgi:transcriptional regulator with XRE-family HTH domain
MDYRDQEKQLEQSVRELRLSKRLTQHELAEQANVSIGAVRNLENARGSSTATLLRVLHALGNDGWITQLAPSSTFNPLDLVAARRIQSRPRGPSRVRHAAEGHP